MTKEPLCDRGECPTGTVTLTLTVEVPVEAIVCRWTKAEAAALVAGDKEAREELFCQAASRRALWSGFEFEDEDVEFHG